MFSFIAVGAAAFRTPLRRRCCCCQGNGPGCSHLWPPPTPLRTSPRQDPPEQVGAPSRGRGLAAGGASLPKPHKYAKPRNAAVFREAPRLLPLDYEVLLIYKWSRNLGPFAPPAGSRDRLPYRRIRHIEAVRTSGGSARSLLNFLIDGPWKKGKCGDRKADE